MEEVVGSIPTRSTIIYLKILRLHSVALRVFTPRATPSINLSFFVKCDVVRDNIRDVRL